jgi:hypothetical protein
MSSLTPAFLEQYIAIIFAECITYVCTQLKTPLKQSLRSARLVFIS